MPSHFCITLRFLQPLSHSRGDGGEPEWPASPLRVFQALVSAAAARWNERMQLAYAAPALSWLEQQPAPSIVAAVGTMAKEKHRLYVPDNSGDLAAGTWSRGDTTKIVRRTEKDVRPVHLDGEAIHYLYPLHDNDLEFARHREVLAAAARSITHLGWGIDMVAGNAAVIDDNEATNLAGQTWRPVESASGKGLRVTIKGTLQGLMTKHEAFLNRLGPDGFKPVPPLSAFRVVGYAHDTDPPPRLFEAFSILKTDADGFRPYDPVRKTHVVAGMVRHAAAGAARGWTSERICTLIHGHTPDGKQKGRSEDGVGRFAYVPLPTIGTKGGKRFDVAGSIRRVVIVGNGVAPGDFAWARRALSGQELIDQDSKKPAALLTLLPKTDHHVRLYTDAASVWDTVSPVVLPGHDDGNEGKAEKLLRNAIRQAGFSDTLAGHAQLEWRKVGFRPGVDVARRYVPPHYLEKYPRYHVRIEWRDSDGTPIQVRGPIVLGGGRFCGFGLFAPSI